jgi:hypothetical protein
LAATRDSAAAIRVVKRNAPVGILGMPHEELSDQAKRHRAGPDCNPLRAWFSRRWCLAGIRGDVVAQFGHQRPARCGVVDDEARLVSFF